MANISIPVTASTTPNYNITPSDWTVLGITTSRAALMNSIEKCMMEGATTGLKIIAEGPAIIAFTALDIAINWQTLGPIEATVTGVGSAGSSILATIVVGGMVA